MLVKVHPAIDAHFHGCFQVCCVSSPHIRCMLPIPFSSRLVLQSTPFDAFVLCSKSSFPAISRQIRIGGKDPRSLGPSTIPSMEPFVGRPSTGMDSSVERISSKSTGFQQHLRRTWVLASPLFVKR